MKFITLLAILISIIYIQSKKVSNEGTKSKGKLKEKSTVHFKKGKNKKQFNPAAQLSEMQGLNSYSYGYGTSDNTLSDYVGLESAKIMPRIPIHLNPDFPFTGVSTEANTNISGNKLYYDGRNNLNAVHIQCKTYSTNPQSCVHNSQCGWCGESGTCIPGNIKGPLLPCLRNTFLYTSPGPFWNPAVAGDINNRAFDNRRIPQFVIDRPPNNIDEAAVWKPYM